MFFSSRFQICFILMKNDELMIIKQPVRIFITKYLIVYLKHTGDIPTTRKVKS